MGCWCFDIGFHKIVAAASGLDYFYGMVFESAVKNPHDDRHSIVGDQIICCQLLFGCSTNLNTVPKTVPAHAIKT